MGHKSKVIIVVCWLAAVTYGSLLGDRQCFAPTQCDANFASCTIGLNCFGSPITQCGFGNGSENGACQTFSDGTTVYCECNTCIGVLNSYAYSCACGGGPPGITCPSGTLVTCIPNPVLAPLLGIPYPQYSCCQSVTGGC